jgi:hypothetical protein
MKQKMQKLSAWCFGLSLVTFALNYVCFHFLTDAGFTAVWQPEAGKPFVTALVGQLGVLLLFGAIMSLLAAKILFGEKEA